MKHSVICIVCLIVMSSIVHAQNTEEILAHYRTRGLTFSRMIAAPAQKVGEMLVIEIYGRLQIPVRIIKMPGKRALVSAKDGAVDGECQRIMRVQEVAPTLIRLSPHISQFEGTVFTKIPDMKVEGWDSIKDYNIGVREGVQYIEDATKGFRRVEIIHDDPTLFQFLNSDRVDLIINPRFNGLIHLKQLNLENVIRPISPPLATFRVYNYLHVKHRKLAPIIEDLLVKMYVSGELQELRERFQQEVIATTTPR